MGYVITFIACVIVVALLLLDGREVPLSRCDQHGGVYSRQYDGSRVVGVKCVDGTGFSL